MDLLRKIGSPSPRVLDAFTPTQIKFIRDLMARKCQLADAATDLFSTADKQIVSDIARFFAEHNRKKHDSVQTAALIPENGVAVEVGCFAGYSALKWLASKLSLLICVDPWQNGYDKNDVLSDAISMKAAEIMFEIRVGSDPRVFKMKAASLDAAKQFPDNSLDFVYIDGNHTEKAVRADIAAWLPKVKPGGYLAGHDWQFAGVKKAVRALLGEPVRLPDRDWVVQKS